MTQPDQEGNGSLPAPAARQWFMVIVTVPILVGLLWYGRDFLIPIVLATLLFILIMAVIDRLNAARIAGRAVPSWVAYGFAVTLVVGLLVVLGYSVSNQATAFGEAIPRYEQRLATIESQIEGLIGVDTVDTIRAAIQKVDIGGWIAGFAASAAGIIGNIGLILLYLAFMLAERGALIEKLPKLCKSPKEATKVQDILKSISIGVRQYMWINSQTSAMSGTLAFVVLKFLGVDFATSLALTVFLLNFIPNIGSILAVLLPTLVALLQFDTITPALIVVVVYGGGDAIIGNIVQPRLQGKSLNLSPFVVMVALTFWGMMWGGVGAFIAVPLTVVIMIVCSQVPGLQPVARLLSSDGVLPGEQEAPDSRTAPVPDRERRGSAGAAAGRDPGASPAGGRDLDMEAEIAALRQELLDQRTAKHTAAGAADDPADQGGREPPETPG